jgi:hypothetical protein
MLAMRVYRSRATATDLSSNLSPMHTFRFQYDPSTDQAKTLL